jgi:hypothetical protein
MLAWLTKVAEPFSLICILRSVRTSSWRRGSSFSSIATSVLPFDQPHVYEREEHASTGQCDLDGGSPCVSGTFGCREEVSRTDARQESVFDLKGRRAYLRNSLCQGDSKWYSNRTSRLATSVVGGPSYYQWSAN